MTRSSFASQSSFFCAAIFVKNLLYILDTRLLVAIMGRQTSTLILNNFIRCTMLRAQNKISKRMYIVKNSNSCEYWRTNFELQFDKKGNLLPPCCPRTVWATRAVAPAAPVAPAPLLLDLPLFCSETTKLCSIALLGPFQTSCFSCAERIKNTDNEASQPIIYCF